MRNFRGNQGLQCRGEKKVTPRERLFSWKKMKKKPGHPVVSANRVGPPTSASSAEWKLETGSLESPRQPQLSFV